MHFGAKSGFTLSVSHSHVHLATAYLLPRRRYATYYSLTTHTTAGVGKTSIVKTFITSAFDTNVCNATHQVVDHVDYT